MVEHDTICKKGLYALYYAFYVQYSVNSNVIVWK